MGPRVKSPPIQSCASQGWARQFGFLWAGLGWPGKAGPRYTVLYCTSFVLRQIGPISITQGRDKPSPFSSSQPRPKGCSASSQAACGSPAQRPWQQQGH